MARVTLRATTWHLDKSCQVSKLGDSSDFAAGLLGERTTYSLVPLPSLRQPSFESQLWLFFEGMGLPCGFQSRVLAVQAAASSRLEAGLTGELDRPRQQKELVGILRRGAPWGNPPYYDDWGGFPLRLQQHSRCCILIHPAEST